MKVMQNSQITDLTSVRKQIGELSSDLQAFERRQAAKPLTLTQDELFRQLSTGKAPRTAVPQVGRELSQEELLSQLQAQAGTSHPLADQAGPAGSQPPTPAQPAGLSQDSLLEMLKTEANKNV